MICFLLRSLTFVIILMCKPGSPIAAHHCVWTVGYRNIGKGGGIPVWLDAKPKHFWAVHSVSGPGDCLVGGGRGRET